MCATGRARLAVLRRNAPDQPLGYNCRVDRLAIPACVGLHRDACAGWCFVDRIPHAQVLTSSRPSSATMPHMPLDRLLYLNANVCLGDGLILQVNLFQFVTLSVAINSNDYKLLTIIISNQFVELKGSVFKRITVNNLFQISCSDIRERLHLKPPSS